MARVPSSIMACTSGLRAGSSFLTGSGSGSGSAGFRASIILAVYQATTATAAEMATLPTSPPRVYIGMKNAQAIQPSAKAYMGINALGFLFFKAFPPMRST